MKGKMEQNQESLTSATSISSKQSPEMVSQYEMSTPTVQRTEPNDEKKQLAIKKIRKYGIIGLAIGAIVLVGLFLPLIVFGGDNNNPAAGAIVYLIYAPIYMYIRIGGMIACIILLILTLINIKRYRLKFSKYVVMTIIGLLLIFSPYIYSKTRKAIITSDPYKITAGDMGIYDCQSSARRASNEYWSDVNSLGGNPMFIAEDIACSYLEYFYDNHEEPSSGTQLSQYYQSYNAKNGIATITINANQPDKANVYNIITHRSCAYDDTNNDSAISVWFRVEKENNGIGCVDVTADDYSNGKINYLNLYNLEESKEWFEWQFKEEIDSNEARELIENKRKTSNDDTWLTGKVEITGKSKDGYYLISYEKIKSDGTTAELTMLFHRENGDWVLETPSSNDNSNKHNFKSL